ncbi:MAG: anhydro-N-acetylmuramic acid kinase [Rhodocyclaceae bacterium]|nr:MAG: anhydro-N-acetylmuramic acid kinase [Rhodocyclaceae bacterium]
MTDLIVGLMSGTSLDGVDAALVDFAGAVPEVIATAYLPYSETLREHVLRLHIPGHDDLHQAELIANRLASLYAEATLAVLDKAGVAGSEVRAIGCHGQTIRHAPQHGYTLQLNNPALLAELTGIMVVADFRSRDIAAGGQGAPLVPAFHSALFRVAERNRLILNLGGIANLTILLPGKPTFGFDCGPGNMLLDAWTQLHLGISHDNGGRWAASGKVLAELLAQLLEDEFFKLQPPKSCGREQFNLSWLNKYLSGRESAVDVQATLLALTVSAIHQAILNWCGIIGEIYVCGGGVHNLAMLKRLKETLPEAEVRTTEALGLPADWVEAVAFAWLARCTIAGIPGNLPEVTGARGLRVLGAIYPA